MKPKIVSVPIGSDIARFGFAILVATGFGAIQVFVIPRRLDIATYGEYRLFLLYVGYIGVLHFGLADGAFLRWAGRPASTIRGEIGRVSRWLFGICAGLFVLALAGVATTGGRLYTVYFIGIAAAALAMNVATLVGYALQAGGDFRGAGRVAALSPALFVAAVVLLPMHSLIAVVTAYVASFAMAATIGAFRLTSAPAGAATTHGDALDFRLMIRQGLPVLGANIAATLSQFGDRILVSIAVPITVFALYGFASSVMVTANAATQALSRVALSHAARHPVAGEARAILMGGFYDLIGVGFGIAMAGVPLFELLVTRTLPAYATALPIVRALVFGAPFWVAIHVVLVGTLQSYGMVRRQLLLELLGLTLVVVICGACLMAKTSLWVVAAGNTAAAIVTWTVGIAVVPRIVPGVRAQPSARFAAIVIVQAIAIGIAMWMHRGWVEESAIYVALAGMPTLVAVRAARRHGW